MLLWIGALLCYISVLIDYLDDGQVDWDNAVLGAVLVVVVLVTGSFMYYQERKSQSV